MVRYYNQRCLPVPKFKISEKVFFNATNISTTRLMKKIAHQYLGPFAIVHPVSSYTCQLKLPPSMSRIHPVFHVVKLMPIPSDPIKGQHVKSPPPPKIIGGKERYEVEEVIDSCMRSRRLQYLVRWKGYGHKENSWILENNLDTPKLISKFYRVHPNALKCINAMMFGHIGF
jgi:Chromo (CHRromatin Organisation MOdifier) domain